MSPLESGYWPAPAPARLVNGLLFNLSWFAIVLTQSSILAPVIVALHLWLHFHFMRRQRGEVILIAGVTLAGALLDQFLFFAGVFNLAGEPALAPLWLTCLWPVFATTLMHAFDGLERRLVLAAALGASGGCLSYIAGVRLTDIAFGSALWGPVALLLLWAALLPLLLRACVLLRGNSRTLQSWSPAARRALD